MTSYVPPAGDSIAINFSTVRVVDPIELLFVGLTGAAAGELVLAGLGSGSASSVVSGGASGVLGLSGTAFGEHIEPEHTGVMTGVMTGVLGFDGHGMGFVTAYGQASASLVFSGIGAGSRGYISHGSAALVFSGLGYGRVGSRGAMSGGLEFGGRGIGKHLAAVVGESYGAIALNGIAHGNVVRDLQPNDALFIRVKLRRVEVFA